MKGASGKAARIAARLLMLASLVAAPAALAVAQNQPAETDPNAESDIGAQVLEALRSGPPKSGGVETAPSIPGDTVVMRGLDKLTGEVETFEAKVGEEAHYGRLLIDAKICYQHAAARAPDSTAFLQIFDTKPDPDALSFSGWMFASSPALSAMDHARYDVWVLSCKTS